MSYAICHADGRKLYVDGKACGLIVSNNDYYTSHSIQPEFTELYVAYTMEQAEAVLKKMGEVGLGGFEIVEET